MDNRAWLSGASATPPTAPVSPSSGYPTGGNPLTATPPTNPGAFWFHQTGEELRGVIVAAGLTPSTGALDQLLTALQALFGWTQTWYDVTGSRASGTPYTNSTGKPIQVLVSLPDTVSLEPTVTVVVGGVTIINALKYDSGPSYGAAIPAFIVPPGATYTVTVAGGGTIGLWAELR